MGFEPAGSRMAALLRTLRLERGISRRQLADEAGVNPSVVHRAENGLDARISTWDKLFLGLGYYVEFGCVEVAEEAADLLSEEAARRRDRRWRG